MFKNTIKTKCRSILMKSYASSCASPIKSYASLLENKILKPDTNQFRAVNKIQVLYNELQTSNFKRISLEQRGNTAVQQKGLYLHGDVGTGKTLLLDLFYDSLPIKEKKRVHFNMFMLYLYSELNKWNLCLETENVGHLTTPTMHVAETILKDCWLICFDEVQLADYASSALVASVFQHLLDKGAVIVATSNRAPQDLGDSGLTGSKEEKEKIEKVVPDVQDTFCSLFEKNCDVFFMESIRDHRTEMTLGENRFLYRNNEDKDLKFDEMFVNVLPKGKKLTSSVLEIYGRKIHIPLCCGDVARFSFRKLCCIPLGPADYLKICNTYEHLFVDDIPKMTLHEKSEARRFLTFIDAAYECRCKVYLNAYASVDELFEVIPQNTITQMEMDMFAEMAFDLKIANMMVDNLNFLTGEDELFSFKRAISRIKEMQCALYQQCQHRQQNFLPYVGSTNERISADSRRREREQQRQLILRKESENDNSELIKSQTRNFKETDWGDEASYITLSQELSEKPYNDRMKDAPVFNDSHFWGFGWWEKLIDKFGKSRPKDS